MGFLFVAACVLAALYALYKLVLGYARDTRQSVRNPPESGTLATLGTGLLRGLAKRSGVMEGEVPSARLVKDVTLSTQQIELFERSTVLAGGRASEALAKGGYHTLLSTTFPQALSVKLAASLIVSRGFPLSPLGILHIGQTITQHRALPAGGSYQVEVFFARYPGGLLFNETDKGVELTLRTTLVDRNARNELVWEGDTVVLSRGAAPSRRRGPSVAFEKPQWEHQSTHVVGEATGRGYAAASGDFNPHHLYWWSALPMGFSRPIAHGMWTLSSALHELAAVGATKEGAFPLRVACEFKKPLLMPATVTFGYRRHEGKVHFGVYDKSNTDPHVIGQVSQ